MSTLCSRVASPSRRRSCVATKNTLAEILWRRKQANVMSGRLVSQDGLGHALAKRHVATVKTHPREWMESTSYVVVAAGLDVVEGALAEAKSQARSLRRSLRDVEAAPTADLAEDTHASLGQDCVPRSCKHLWNDNVVLADFARVPIQDAQMLLAVGSMLLCGKPSIYTGEPSVIYIMKSKTFAGGHASLPKKRILPIRLLILHPTNIARIQFLRTTFPHLHRKTTI